MTSRSSATATADTASLRHPKGLYLLFATEMWERMSFYGMRSLLVLYMTKETGFGWNDDNALDVYSWYMTLVYLTPIIGGYLADRFLGQRWAVLMGGTLIMAGHFLLALPGVPLFFAALGFLVLGNGLFKPNISTMVGGLYPPKDPRRDSAFSIFYMGINLGGALGGIVCGYLGQQVAWHYGFGAAGVGMLIGLVAFALLNRQMLGQVGLTPVKQTANVQALVQRPSLTREDWQRLIVLFVIVTFFAAPFWAGFEQAGGLMNLYTDRKVSHVILGFKIPSTWFQSVNSIFIIVFSPVFGWLWLVLSARGKDPSPVVKMGVGMLLLGLGFGVMCLSALQNQNGGLASPYLLLSMYLLHTFGELCLSPVGLSLTTKLAPRHLASGMMGVWFLSNFMGNRLSGVLGKLAKPYGELSVFTGFFIGATALGLVLFTLSPLLKRMMHGADQLEPAEDSPAKGSVERSASSAAG